MEHGKLTVHVGSEAGQDVHTILGLASFRKSAFRAFKWDGKYPPTPLLSAESIALTFPTYFMFCGIFIVHVQQDFRLKCTKRVGVSLQPCSLSIMQSTVQSS
jgi:hypothetical protein